MGLEKKYEKEISIPYALYQSEKGNYFIGETPFLNATNQKASCALANPADSNVIIFLNAITVTNSSTLNISSEFFLKDNLQGAQLSNSVSCANLAQIPQPVPEGQIQYLSTTSHPPYKGVSIFSRIVSSYSTQVIDGGQIIIAPGQSLIVYLGGYLPIAQTSTVVAFGWWEEPLSPCLNTCYK